MKTTPSSPCDLAVVAVPQENNQRIPFNRPYLTGREMEQVQHLMVTRHLSGDGPYTRKCSQMLEAATGGRKVLLTTSCTHALEMSALLLKLAPGDEVIVPSFTFVSTATAFALRGVKIVFADVRPDTLNLNEKLLPQLITPRTKAIVVVHYAGVACEMDKINAIAAAHGIPVVEDNAHGLYGYYKSRPLGSIGVMATQSFHETKNVQCGEGGALVLNDPALIERAEILREKGTNRSKFFRGQVDRYTWVDHGSSYLPSEILAAFLSCQLESAATIQDRRRQIWDCYDVNLRQWAQSNGIKQPTVPAHCTQAYHMYYLLMPSLETRTAFIAHLREHDIMAVFHYQALNSSPMGSAFGGYAGQCPVTEDVSDRLVRLPLYFELSDSDLDRIIATITGWTP